MTVSTPWGTYALVRDGVWRSIERPQSFWVAQVCGPLPGVHVEEAVVPVHVARKGEVRRKVSDARNEPRTAADRPERLPVPASRQGDGPVRDMDHTAAWLAELEAVPLLIPAPPTLGGYRPGCAVARGEGSLPSWTGCLTRVPEACLASPDDPLRLQPHLFFLKLDPDERGVLYCPECRDRLQIDYGELNLPAPAPRSEPPLCIVKPMPYVIIYANFEAIAALTPLERATALFATAVAPVGCCPAVALGREIHDPRCHVGGYWLGRRIPTTGKEWDEEFRERASIIEYSGGYARSIAERLAREMIGPRP